ncbi:hypothetical protein ACFVT1_40070 [Streptomyces sp. NPDC057963]|uniref:hypothetical protein n=1 Tax=Streptomyces sp. NPDC057963 TaxID=3346290 RepID=UPI0036DFFE3A
MGDFHLPVGAVGDLRLVEGDDGVDQGRAVLPQARLAGRSLARGPARRRRELTGAASARPAGVQYQ